MSWWKSLFRKRALDTQLDSELRFHIEEMTEGYIAAGMAPEEARRQATLEFGGREQIKEDLRDVHRVAIETAIANLKSAFRFLRNSPSFSIAVILTLALGIGANSAVFSAIDAILLRPLPFPDGDRSCNSRNRTEGKDPESCVAPVRLEDWNRMNSTFQAIAGYYTEDDSETSGALPEKLNGALWLPGSCRSGGFVPFWGATSPDEERFGGASRADQRSLLAPPLRRRSECIGKRLPRNGNPIHRWHHAGIVFVSRPRRWIPSLPDASLWAEPGINLVQPSSAV